MISGKFHIDSRGKYMKVLVFGTGLFFENRKEYFKDVDIVAFIDNDSKKHGIFLEGRPIISLNEGLKMPYDIICLMSIHKSEMKKQLIDLGIPSDKIIDFNEIGKIVDNQQMTVYYKKTSIFEGSLNNKILLLSHELSYTGAPIVLLYVAQILKNNGYKPIIISPKDGELRKDIVDCDIPVVIDKYIYSSNEAIWRWIKEFGLLFINTATFHYLIKDFEGYGIPIIWWLHEGNVTYEALDKNELREVVPKNVSVYAVGSWAIENYVKYTGNSKVYNLLYGIPDKRIKDNQILKTKKKIIFAIIGTIIPRKAQDIFIQSIELLDERDRGNAEFWLIGKHTDNIYNKEIELRAKNISQIKFFGELEPSKLKKVYQNIDVVVCPSRDDPMPVVLTEAMMFEKVCIASEATGTAALFDDKKNGLICKTENPKNLAEQLTWVLKNKDKLQEIGHNARKLYEECFSMDIFEKNIMEIVSKNLKNYF